MSVWWNAYRRDALRFINDVCDSNSRTLNDAIIFSLKKLGLTELEIRNNMSKKGKLIVSPDGHKQFEWEGVPMVREDPPQMLLDRDEDTHEGLMKVITTYRVLK